MWKRKVSQKQLKCNGDVVEALQSKSIICTASTVAAQQQTLMKILE